MASQLLPPERNESALAIAIKDVSHEKLRSLFIAICENIPEAKQQAEAELLVQTENDGSSPESRPRFAPCANCKTEFDARENLKDSCRYHPLGAEPTEEADPNNFDDDFEVPEEQMREEHPHLFEFECCHDTLLDNPHGCVVDFHVDIVTKKKIRAGKAAAEAQSIPSTDGKRMISRYAFCTNCEDEFDTADNTEKSCCYHPEDSEPTDDMYDDVYENDPDPDTEENREDFPENFRFTCCEETLEENPKGCVVGFHVAAASTPKRARLY